MSNTVKINHKENTIVISQKIAKRAEIFGTDEYMLLQKARKDYPSFTVSFEEKNSTKKDSIKGLTYEFMINYISKNDPDGEIMEEYLMLRGETEEAKELGAEPVSYGEMRKWFLDKFPRIKKFYDTRDQVLGKNAA